MSVKGMKILFMAFPLDIPRTNLDESLTYSHKR